MTPEPTPDPPVDAEIDAALRDAYAFAPAAAEEAAARFRLPAPRPVRWPWFALPAAVAAGIGVGLLLAPPLTEKPTPGGEPAIEIEPSTRIVGFLTAATRPVRQDGGPPLKAGDPVTEMRSLHVPTDGRAIVMLADGTEVRLDRGAIADFYAPEARTFVVRGGRVWTHVAPGKPFLVNAEEAKVTVTGTELSVNRIDGRILVQLFSGAARVDARVHGEEKGRDLAPGTEVEFSYESGRLSEVRRTYSEAIATGWMIELYAYAGRHERDLAEHMDRMLAEMGRRKMAHLEERAIVEELGPVCRVPVARFLVSEAAKAESETGARRKAARVLETIADASVAAELAAALRDPDAEVRVSAAKAIRRVSDGTACAEPAAFQGSCDMSAAAAADAWARSCSPTPPK